MHQSEGTNSLGTTGQAQDTSFNVSQKSHNICCVITSVCVVLLLFSFFFSKRPKVEPAAVVRSLAKRQRIPPPSFGCRLNKLNFTLDAHKENSCDCNSFCATWLVWLRPTGWMNWEHLRRLIRAVVCIWCRLDLIFFFFLTLTARWGSQGSTAAPLRPDWFFTTFHIKCKPVSLQSCKVNLLISQLLF